MWHPLTYQGSCLQGPSVSTFKNLLDISESPRQCPGPSLPSPVPPPHNLALLSSQLLLLSLCPLCSLAPAILSLSDQPGHFCGWPFSIYFFFSLSGLFYTHLAVLSHSYNKTYPIAVSLLCSPCIHLTPKLLHTHQTSNGTKQIFPSQKSRGKAQQRKMGAKQDWNLAGKNLKAYSSMPCIWDTGSNYFNFKVFR